LRASPVPGWEATVMAVNGGTPRRGRTGQRRWMNMTIALNPPTHHRERPLLHADTP
jgi:hypothetical protein